MSEKIVELNIIEGPGTEEQRKKLQEILNRPGMLRGRVLNTSDLMREASVSAVDESK